MRTKPTTKDTPALTLEDFQEVEKLADMGTVKYPGEPYVGILNSGCMYYSPEAMKMVDVRDASEEGVRYVVKGGSVYVIRAERGSRGVFAINLNSRNGSTTTFPRKMHGMLTTGDHMLSQPLHVGGLDLFEIIPIKRYRELQNEQWS